MLRLTTICLFLFLFSGLKGQAPFCSFSCSDPVGGGCISCDVESDLSGAYSYELFMQGGLPGNPDPICSQVVNNTLWFVFVAGSTEIDIDFSLDNCFFDSGLNIGIQDGCGGECFAITSCQAFSGTLSVDELVIGQLYAIFIDGCSGSACDFELDISNPVSYTHLTLPTICSV